MYRAIAMAAEDSTLPQRKRTTARESIGRTETVSRFARGALARLHWRKHEFGQTR